MAVETDRVATPVPTQFSVAPEQRAHRRGIAANHLQWQCRKLINSCFDLAQIERLDDGDISIAESIMIRQDFRFNRVDGRNVDPEQDYMPFPQQFDCFRFEYRNPLGKLIRNRESIRL